MLRRAPAVLVAVVLASAAPGVHGEEPYRVKLETGVKATMRDGVVLLADRWTPRDGASGLLTVLVRSPCGRAAGVMGAMMGRPLAERGVQVRYEP